MFEFLRRQPERDPLEAALDPEHLYPDKGEMVLLEPSHIRKLKEDKGGPYYLAPDSAEPLPSGMYADIDPEGVVTYFEKTQKELDAAGLGWSDVTPGVRELLLDNGPAGRKLLARLEGGSVDNWPDWLEKPESLMS